MTAWLVAENGLRLARVDTVTAVTLDVDNERDDPTKYHPTKWLMRAKKVRLMVGVQGYEAPMCALTCPGKDATEALGQLMGMLADLSRKHSGSADTVYLHAIYQDWPSRLPDRLWRVTTSLPDQEWILR